MRSSATDLDWSRCRGGEISGPAESFLMVSGRHGITGELGGPGAPPGGVDR
ncbi:hypothetical protein [Nocardia carnea]|uniref:hypothetical protein n=1 Tax=Nocardia carnea TaxID=37328 RepID=UPI002454A84C|nr:hypothetical protein [Nocardia carnea]